MRCASKFSCQALVLVCMGVATFVFYHTEGLLSIPFYVTNMFNEIVAIDHFKVHFYFFYVLLYIVVFVV